MIGTDHDLRLGSFHRLRCEEIIRHPHNFRIQFLDVIDYDRQILDDHFAWQFTILPFFKRHFEVSGVVAGCAADVYQQRVALFRIEALKQLLLGGIDVKPFWAILTPAFQHVEEVAKLLGSLHQVLKLVQVCLEGELPISFGGIVWVFEVGILKESVKVAAG